MLGFNYEDKYVYEKSGKQTSEGWTMNGVVVITCKTKKTTIQGVLSNSLELEGRAKWKEMFNGGIFGLSGGILQAGSNISQILGGKTLQQPWMNRKFYESSEPLSFTMEINFVSHGGDSAKKQVYDPVRYLLSLVYPRKGGGNAVGNALVDNGGKDDAGKPIGGGSLVGTMINTMQEMHIPGPSLGYTEGAEDAGDSVSITIGQTFAFVGVYIDSVQATFSPTFNAEGYPLWAKCKVKATCMDSLACDSNGDFLSSGFKVLPSAEMSAFIDQAKITGTTAAKDLGNLKDSYKEFYGYFLGGAK